MNDLIRAALNAVPKIHVIEAYTGRHISYRQRIDGLDMNRFAEVRFYPNEMPVVYYETDHALKMVRENSPELPCNKVTA